MKFILRVAAVAILGALSFSSGAFAAGMAGTWVFDLAKSTAVAGFAPKSMTLTISDLGGGKWKSVTETVLSAGTTAHSELTFAFDGKDYTPVTTPKVQGAPAIAQSFERVNDSTIKQTLKLNGTPIDTMTSVVAGNILTVTHSQPSPEGKVMVQVFERK